MPKRTHALRGSHHTIQPNLLALIAALRYFPRGTNFSRISQTPTSTASPCGSINVRERPWASKRQPINYERCCTDRLNSQP